MTDQKNETEIDRLTREARDTHVRYAPDGTFLPEDEEVSGAADRGAGATWDRSRDDEIVEAWNQLTVQLGGHPATTASFAFTAGYHAALAKEQAARAAVERAILDFDVRSEADQYEFRGEGDYLPNEKERLLLEDFGNGLVGDLHDRIRKAALASPSPEGDAGGVAFDLIAHLERQRAFSLRTFGPGTRTKGVCDHIRKELREIEAEPDDADEWVDVVLLGLDGLWRSGVDPTEAARRIEAKQTKNEGRTWPDWRTMSPDQAIEHDRSEDQGR